MNIVEWGHLGQAAAACWNLLLTERWKGNIDNHTNTIMEWTRASISEAGDMCVRRHCPAFFSSFPLIGPFPYPYISFSTCSLFHSLLFFNSSPFPMFSLYPACPLLSLDLFNSFFSTKNPFLMTFPTSHFFPFPHKQLKTRQGSPVDCRPFPMQLHQ